VGRTDHFGLVEDDPDVSDVGAVGAEEDEVAGLEWLAGRDGRTGVVLLLGCAWELESGGGVGGLSETGAVKTSGLVATPLVARTDLGERIADRVGDDSGVGAVFAAQLLGESEDFLDVAGGVVVVVDGGRECRVLAGAVGAEVSGGGVDRIGRVVRGWRVLAPAGVDTRAARLAS
jgi:hypothetical protein